MVEKVIFDANNRLIIVDAGITQLDAETDLYSAAKRMWKVDATLNKLRLPFRTVAGDPLGQNREIGAYFFLQNQAGADWRIRPDEVDHELTIIGNLYAEDTDLPMFIPTVGDYTVSISMEKSSLTQVLISGSGVTEQDKIDISNKIWEHNKGVQVVDDLDNPNQYKADVSQMALESTSLGIKGKTDKLPDDPASETSVGVAISQLDLIQADLDNPDQFKANVSGLATNISVQDVIEKLVSLLQIERGRWEINSSTCRLTYFDEADSVPLLIFEMQDEEGKPSLAPIFKRVPVKDNIPE